MQRDLQMSHRCSKCFKSTFGVFANLKSKSTKSTSSVLASFSVTLSKSTFRVLYNLGGGFGAKVQIHLFFKSTKSTRSTKSTQIHQIHPYFKSTKSTASNSKSTKSTFFETNKRFHQEFSEPTSAVKTTLGDNSSRKNCKDRQGCKRQAKAEELQRHASCKRRAKVEELQRQVARDERK